MLLLSKVRDSVYFICISGRPWEAVRGRAPLIGLEICVRESQIYWSQWEEHGLSRPLTASHGLSLLSCDLSEPIREHGLSRTRPHTASQIWESDRPLTHTGRCCHPRGCLTDFTAKRIASPGRVRSASHAQRPRVRSSGLSDWFHG